MDQGRLARLATEPLVEVLGLGAVEQFENQVSDEALAIGSSRVFSRHRRQRHAAHN